MVGGVLGRGRRSWQLLQESGCRTSPNNRTGDCWHAGSKTLDWSGVMLTYHDDDWWDAHKGDAQFRLHESDAQHDWQRGYWRDGKWHGGF